MNQPAWLLVCNERLHRKDLDFSEVPTSVMRLPVVLTDKELVKNGQRFLIILDAEGGSHFVHESFIARK